MTTLKKIPGATTDYHNIKFYLKFLKILVGVDFFFFNLDNRLLLGSNYHNIKFYYIFIKVSL